MSQQSTGKSVMVQGRIVWTIADLFKGKVKTDQNTRQQVIDPKTGSPVVEFGFGLAVPKSELQPGKSGAELWAALHEEAYQIYPSRQVPPAFAWKYKDGDGVDHNGVPFGNREGYAQHIIFSLTTRLPLKFFRFENGAYLQINDGIKCGDFVQVQVQVKAHAAAGTGKPGLYLNPMMALFLGYGKEIINTPSPEQAFGTQAPTLPAGASATPIGVPAMPTGFGAAPYGAPPQAPGAMPYGQPAPAPVQPHHAVLPPQFQQQAPPMPGGAAVPFTGQPPQAGYAPPPAMEQQSALPPQGYAFAQPATPGGSPQYPNPGPAMPPMPPRFP